MFIWIGDPTVLALLSLVINWIEIMLVRIFHQKYPLAVWNNIIEGGGSKGNGRTNFYNTSRTVYQTAIIQILLAKFQHAITSIKVGKRIRKPLIEEAYITTLSISFSVDLNPNLCTVVRMVLNYRGYLFIIICHISVSG